MEFDSEEIGKIFHSDENSRGVFRAGKIKINWSVKQENCETAKCMAL